MKTIFQHIKRNAKLYQSFLDLIIAVFSYFTAYFISNLYNTEYFTFTNDYVLMLFLVIPTWIIITKATNLSQIPRSRSYLSMFFQILNFNLIGFFVLLIFKHIFVFTLFSHYFLLAFSLTNTIFLFSARLITYKILKSYRYSGHNIHNLIIIADEQSESIIDNILDHFEWGYRIVAIISNSEHIRNTYSPMIRVLPERSNLKNLLKIDIIDELLYCKHSFEIDQVDKYFETCHELGVTFKVKSEVVPVKQERGELTHIEKTPFLTFINTPNTSFRWIWKSISDFIIAASLIFILSPVFLIISLIIRLTSKGHVIFKQRRVGLHGRQFYIYKFRTMIHNAESMKTHLVNQNESNGPTFKIKNDPRVTPIGRLLRKLSLDELPQLFNVLKGEMSLIGPRPPLPSEVEEYEDWQIRRLSVKPGITCTWQIIPNRNDVVFEKWMKLDMEYIDKWSLKSDWGLFFKTIKSVIANKGY